jgi:hypothetical protein
MLLVPSILTFSIFLAVQKNELDALRKIANDKDEKVQKRVDAIASIFLRHVPKRVELESLSKTLGRPAWLDRSRVKEVKGIMGSVPVELGEALFLIHILEYDKADDFWMWVSTEDRLGLDQFVAALKGTFAQEKTKKIRIRDCAICEIVDKVTLKILYHMYEKKKTRQKETLMGIGAMNNDVESGVFLQDGCQSTGVRHYVKSVDGCI